jgi:hypothetical protein
MSILVINDLQQTSQFVTLSDSNSHSIIGGGHCYDPCRVICLPKIYIPKICIPHINITWKCSN